MDEQLGRVPAAYDHLARDGSDVPTSFKVTFMLSENVRISGNIKKTSKLHQTLRTDCVKTTISTRVKKHIEQSNTYRQSNPFEVTLKKIQTFKYI